VAAGAGLLYRFHSSITVHAWLSLALVAGTAARLVARTVSRGVSGRRGALHLATAALGLWLLVGAAYVGGVSHLEGAMPTAVILIRRGRR